MEKIKMTHNEYQEFLKKMASKIFSDKNYTYSDYLKDANSIEVLPFNLEKFNLTEDIEKCINVYFKEEYIDKDGIYSLKGFSESVDEWHRLTDKLGLKREMGYYYSGYCHNDNLNFYMTYCEGDLYLKLFDNKEIYKKSLNETIKWYEEEH